MTLRVVPDKGDLHTAQVSEEYDLFVNGSYMSRLAPRATHNAYLCYFPTPFDVDMPRWQQRITRTVGRYVTAHSGGFDYGTGWYPPEGGRRRRWHWASGDAVLSFPPSSKDRVVRVELGGPAMPRPVELRVEDDRGQVLHRLTVGPKFTRHRLTVPASQQGLELHLRADTFSPGGTDDRELAVAASGLRLEGGSYGPAPEARLLLPVDAAGAARPVVPHLLRHRDGQQRVHPRLGRAALADRGRGAVPADPGAAAAPRARAREGGHHRRPLLRAGPRPRKRQKEMVEFFAAASRAGRLPGWRMYVVGGMEDSQRGYVDEVRAAGAGAPVEVITNAPRSQVEHLLSTSSVFWSATGYGEDEARAPWASEHFGMTTVESMAGGCVPVVIDRAGQKEIVREGVDGYRWSTPEQLVARTVEVAQDEALRARLAASATERAQQFSEDAFADRWHAIVDTHSLLG